MNTAKNITDKTAKLAILESQIREAKNARSKFLAAEKAAEKAARTKQMIIVGSWLHANDLLTFDAVVARLERDQDRAAFGLEIKPKISSDIHLTNASSDTQKTEHVADQTTDADIGQPVDIQIEALTGRVAENQSLHAADAAYNSQG